MKHIVVILNPQAGGGRAAGRRMAMERWIADHSAHALWEIQQTAGPGHATELAAQAMERGADLIVAAGGDGTLSEVANGVVGGHVPVGLLPLGTGNDCARHFGIGADLLSGLHTLLHGKPHRVDLGRAGNRYFINIAGCGFDAAVARHVRQGWRRLPGTLAYIGAVLHTLLTFTPTWMRLTLDETPRELRALMCSVANASSYGGGMRIAPNARMSDGLLDVCVIAEAGRIEFLRTFPRVFRGTHLDHPKVQIHRAQRVYVQSDPPVPVLIDGDVCGHTPVEFHICPRAISILIPPDRDAV